MTKKELSNEIFRPTPYFLRMEREVSKFIGNTHTTITERRGIKLNKKTGQLVPCGKSTYVVETIVWLGDDNTWREKADYREFSSFAPAAAFYKEFLASVQ